MNLKKIGKVFTSKYAGPGPSSYEKRIYGVAVSQRLRNSDVVGYINFILQYKNKNPYIHVRKRFLEMKFHTSPTTNTWWINPDHILMKLSKTVVVLIVVCVCIKAKLKIHSKCERKFALMYVIKARPNTFLTSVLDWSKLPNPPLHTRGSVLCNHRITRCVEPRNSLGAFGRVKRLQMLSQLATPITLHRLSYKKSTVELHTHRAPLGA